MSDVRSLDDIYQRFHNGYYHSISAVEEALVSLFDRTLDRCLN